MNPKGPVAALIVIVFSLVGVGLVDAVAEPPATTSPATSPVTDVRSGQAVCAVGDARAGTSTSLALVRPGGTGDAPGIADVRRLGGGDLAPLASAVLDPGAASRADLDEGDDVGSVVRWSQAPITTSRTWRLEGEEDLPPGSAAGPCVPTTSATTWTLPGMTTAGGGEARLRLANPHATGATVAVGFLTPDGPEQPTRLRNISVGPGQTHELTLNEFMPERPDLAVVVDVLSGRVAAEGVQLVRRAIGDVDGVSLLQASTEAGETWTVPWVVDGEGRASWLWVTNRTDRTAPVELTVHTGDGGVVASGMAEVEIPPGTVRRIDLRGTLGDGVRTAAVTVRSAGVPVTVSGAVELRDSDVARTGFAVQLAAEATDPAWTISGEMAPGRSHQLRLVNPGNQPAAVEVSLWNGREVVVPEALADIEVPAGALVAVSLDEALAEVMEEPGPWAAVVRATAGDVVVSQIGQGDADGPMHLVAVTGAPSSWWRTPAGVPAVRSAPGTTQRLGTELGIRPLDPFAPPPSPEEPDTSEEPLDDAPLDESPEDEPPADEEPADASP